MGGGDLHGAHDGEVKEADAFWEDWFRCCMKIMLEEMAACDSIKQECRFKAS